MASSSIVKNTRRDNHQLGAELMAMKNTFGAGGARDELQLLDRRVDPA